MGVAAPHAMLALGVCIALAIAAAGDVRYRRIPNALSAGIAGSGVVHGFLAGGLASGFASFAGIATGLALLFVPWAAHVVGGGDLKLLAAVGAWLGASGTVRALIGAAVLGGILAVFTLARLSRADRTEVRANMVTLAAGGRIQPRRGIPFGAALAVAGAVGLSALTSGGAP